VTASSHPIITSYFGAAHSASLVSTSFFLTATAVQPVVCSLSDSIGRKTTFLGCLLAFCLSVVWSALSKSFTSLIMARALSGIGDGGVMVLGSIIINDIVPIHNMAYGGGCAMGAALGGMIAEHWGWRWSFGIQVPLLAVAFIICLFAIPKDLGRRCSTKTVREALGDFDPKGSLSLTTSISAFILALPCYDGLTYVLRKSESWRRHSSMYGCITRPVLIDSSNTSIGDHPVVVACIVASLICSAAFIWSNSSALNPVMPLYLLKRHPWANF
ncbi:hypothetical protein PG994_013091, partial [Apiospora phragmitis]